MTKEFATKLIELRGEKNLTQQELGDAAGVSPSQISRYEAALAMPRKTVLRKLAEALGVSREELTPNLESKTHELNFGLPIEDVHELQKIAEETGKTLKEVFSDMLRESIKLLKEDPEFAAKIERRIKERRKNGEDA